MIKHMKLGAVSVLAVAGLSGALVLGAGATQAAPSAAKAVAGGSGNGFGTRVVTIPAAGLYTLSVSVQAVASNANLCTTGTVTATDSPTVTLVDALNKTVYSLTMGPMGYTGGTATFTSDTAVQLKAATYTFRIVYQCGNDNSQGNGAVWSFTIS